MLLITGVMLCLLSSCQEVQSWNEGSESQKETSSNPERFARATDRLEGCGYSVDATGGVRYGNIASPNYPQPFPDGLNCTWYLNNFTQIVLRVMKFDLGPSDGNCTNETATAAKDLLDNGIDILEISRGFAPKGMRPTHYEPLGLVCGNTNLSEIPDFYATAAGLEDQVSFRVRYLTKGSRRPNMRRGFVLTWIDVPPFPNQTNPIYWSRPVPNATLYGDLFYVDEIYLDVHDAIVIFIPEHSGNLTFSVKAYHDHPREEECLDLESGTFEMVDGQDGQGLRSFRAIINSSVTVKQYVPVAISVHWNCTIVSLSTYSVLDKAIPVTSTCTSQDGITVQLHESTGITTFGLNTASRPERTTNTNLTYTPLQHCTRTAINFMKDPHEFLTAQVRTDMEDSPSCLNDYIQIGGIRMCGRRSRSVSEPYDRRLMEIAGGIFKNIALLRPSVTQSSLYENNTSYGPDRAVDGFSFSDMDRLSCSLSGKDDTNPWWKLDLLQDFYISAIRITSMRQNRSQSLDVRIYKDREPVVYTWQDLPLVIMENLRQQLNIKPPVKGRVVKIWKESPLLGLCEVQVLVNLKSSFVNSVWDPPSELTAYNVALRKTATYKCKKRSNRYLYTDPQPDLTNSVQGLCALIVPRHHGTDVVHYLIITLATQPGVNYRVYGVLITKDKRPAAHRYTIYVGGNGLNNTIPTGATLCARNQRFSATRLVRCERLTVGSHVRIDVAGITQHVVEICNVQVYGRLYDSRDGLVNVALYKYTRQSGSDTRKPSVRGADGYLGAGTSCTRYTRAIPEADTHLAWWMVDLANFYDVEAVNINLKVAGGSVSNGEVRVYLEDPIDVLVRERGRPGNYVPVGSFLAYDPASLCFSYDDQREARGLRRCNKVLRGRYVFMTQKQSNLELCEMEVMAKTLLSDRRFGLPPDPLNLTYHTDSTFGGTGWNISLQRVDTSKFDTPVLCGPTLLAAVTLIQSPNYPEDYTAPGYAYMCQWIVPTNVNGTTVVEIQDLSLSPKDSEGICSEDALLLSNSIGEQQTLCGSVRNDSFFTVRSIAGDFFYVTLMVRTSSNESAFVRRSGFNLHVYSFAGEVQGNGQISSPEFPESYPNNTVCHWTLTSNTSTLAVFNVLHVNITERDCEQGGVLILWTTDDGSRERKFCDRDDALDPLTVLIQEPHAVQILFQSSQPDPGLGRRRFKIRYFGFSSVSGKCYTGRETLQNRQNYTSPNYPEFYSSSSNVSSVLKYYPPIGASGIFSVTWFDADFPAGIVAVTEVLSRQSTSSQSSDIMMVDGVKSNYIQRLFVKAFSEVRMMWNFTVLPQKFFYGIDFGRASEYRDCRGRRRLRVDSSNQKTEFVLGTPAPSSLTIQGSYSQCVTCDWHIDFANKTQRVPAWVQFYWMNVYLENGQFACRNDYVQIERERYSERVCKMPQQPISFALQKEWPLKVMFKSDILGEGRGFKLKVTVDTRDCVEGDTGYCGSKSGSNTRPCCNSNETCCLGGPWSQGPSGLHPMWSCNLPKDCS